MGLFDALSGRIGHFNSIAVPVHNNIGNKIKNINKEDEKLFFALALDLIAQEGINLFFKPDIGQALKDIKKYNQQDFEKLYSVFIIWAFYDYCSFLENPQKDTLKNILQNILYLKESEFNYYYKKLEHKMTVPLGIEKLWDEITKIIHTIPKTEENHQIFHREFSKICKEAYQKI